jgi:hypothetical protein
MRYAIIKDGVVENIVEATPEVASENGWVQCPEHDDEQNAISPRFLFSNNKFTKPPRNIEAEWNAVRAQRNALLSQSDWTQASDVPQATKDKWAVYRQALRNIPQTFSDPKDVVWPTKPE